MRVPRTARDFRELFKKSENCLKLPRTVWNYRELFETSENCLKLPRTVLHFRELSKNSLELFDTSENYIRSWEHFTRNHERKQWPFRAIVQISQDYTLSIDLSNLSLLIKQNYSTVLVKKKAVICRKRDLHVSEAEVQPRGVLTKRCSENMQQIYARTPMSKCDFNKVALATLSKSYCDMGVLL